MDFDKTLIEKWNWTRNADAMKGGMFKNSTYWGKKTSVLKRVGYVNIQGEAFGINCMVCS